MGSQAASAAFLWTAVDLPQAPAHLCIPAAAAIHTDGRSDGAVHLNCGYFRTKWIPTDDRATGSQARDTDLFMHLLHKCRTVSGSRDLFHGNRTMPCLKQ